MFDHQPTMREIDKTRVLLRVMQGEAGVKRVALDLGMTPEYVRGLVDELERQGLILKEGSEG